MKRILCLIIIGLSFQMNQAQDRLQESTEGFSFEINYWFNIHHFLWMESFMNVNQDSTIIKRKISKKSRKSLNQALGYYKENLTKLDLRSSDYMTEFKHWVTRQDFELTSVPEKFQQHISILQDFSDVYKASFWPTHKLACEKVLNDNIELIRRTEEKFAVGMIKFVRQPWQKEKIKVDITYFGLASTWNLIHRPYTTIFPTHIVMTAIGENDVKGNWVELLYHESTHHLISSRNYFLGGTIKDVCEVMNIEPPRQFWHSYLFYLTGELTKEVFIEEGIPYETTYMQRTGVFGRHYEALDKHLKSYMKREITLEDATKKILTELK